MTAPTDMTAIDTPRYWRSLDDLAQTPQFQEFLRREFQDGASEFPDDGVSRRRFLGVVAAMVAMAGMTSCRKPKRKILPFAKRPEDMLPGVPRYYASAHVEFGYGLGTIVKSSDGRPTMIEGNPEHPTSLGAVNSQAIAELLNLYDPARSKEPIAKGAAPAHDADPQIHQGGAGHSNNGHSDTGSQENAAKSSAQFGAFLTERIAAWKSNGGEGLALLMQPTSSPSIAAQIATFQQTYKKARLHFHAPSHRGNVVQGSTLAFGAPYEVQTKAEAADILVGFDSDFLNQGPGALRTSRQVATRRTADLPPAAMSRIYSIESRYTLTGAAADHRFRVRTHEVASSILALVVALQNEGVSVPGIDLAGAPDPSGFKYGKHAWVPILAKELAAHRGKSLLLCGDQQPPMAHAMIHALNRALGNVGKTLDYTEMPASLAVDATASIKDLSERIASGSVTDLLILGTNPVYDAPANLGFAQQLPKVKHSIHLGLWCDETGRACSWHVNATHPLEAWGDVLAFDGTLAFVQPLIAPLYHGVSELEFIARINGIEKPEGYALLQNHWRAKSSSNAFEGWWARALHDGVVRDTAFSPKAPELRHTDIGRAVAAMQRPAAGSVSNLEASFRLDASMFDGRYANNAWMQELPDPMSKLVWDNAALMSLATAKALGAANGDVFEFSLDGRRLEMPIWVQPGMADFSVEFPLGYGRVLGAGFEVATGAGFDTYKLRGATDFALGMTAKATGKRYKLVTTQDHGAMEGRALVREATLDHWRQNPTFAPDMNPLVEMAKVTNERHDLEHKHAHKHEANGDHKHPAQSEQKVTADSLNQSLWYAKDMPEEHRYSTSKGYQWGMVIDLSACTGCNACVIACQAENTIPTVGKEEVANGREMHWVRLDRYYNGDPYQGQKVDGIPPANMIPTEENPQVVHQVVPCMQCEKAPCEVVCPVAATTHSPEGLNDMVYNRCIGTRYCSNNCPYKVRRFNYLDFHGEVPTTRQMQHNPDVTVRHRGVMEKCTYCVQRINAGKLQAKLQKGKVVDGKPHDGIVRDGAIQTACSSICPTKAITFGNINDKASGVSQRRASVRNYGMVVEMNTKPRTTYLARIRNPNPALLALN